MTLLTSPKKNKKKEYFWQIFEFSFLITILKDMIHIYDILQNDWNLIS